MKRGDTSAVEQVIYVPVGILASVSLAVRTFDQPSEVRVLPTRSLKVEDEIFDAQSEIVERLL